MNSTWARTGTGDDDTGGVISDLFNNIHDLYGVSFTVNSLDLPSYRESNQGISWAQTLPESFRCPGNVWASLVCKDPGLVNTSWTLVLELSVTMPSGCWATTVNASSASLLCQKQALVNRSS